MRYLLRRAGFYLVALWAAITVNFILPRLMPGDPALAYLAKIQAKNPTPALYQALLTQFNVDPKVPIWVQYWNYLTSVLTGHLGVSYSDYPTQVTSILAQSMPWTIGLVGVSLLISFFIGTLVGILAAWWRGSLFDTAIPPILTFLSAVPYFWMALGLIFVFSLKFAWFPNGGIGGGYDVYGFPNGPELSPAFIGSVIQYGELPVITLVIGSLAQWVLTMRNTMVTTLAEDYVLMAKAKGLPERRTMLNYAARNAILPSVTSFSISLGLVVSGALLTEIVFNYPGIGFQLWQGISQNDYPLIEGCFMVIALTVLIANFFSELIYVFLDPRVRIGGR